MIGTLLFPTEQFHTLNTQNIEWYHLRLAVFLKRFDRIVLT